MVATELNRLPSFKNRRTLSPLENEPRERKSNPEKNLSSDREPSANSGLDIETKKFSATGRRRSFFVDIPFYRTTYLKVRPVSCVPSVAAGDMMLSVMRCTDSTISEYVLDAPMARRCPETCVCGQGNGLISGTRNQSLAGRIEDWLLGRG